MPCVSQFDKFRRGKQQTNSNTYQKFVSRRYAISRIHIHTYSYFIFTSKPDPCLKGPGASATTTGRRNSSTSSSSQSLAATTSHHRPEPPASPPAAVPVCFLHNMTLAVPLSRRILRASIAVTRIFVGDLGPFLIFLST